ncbi:MAG TPA: OadG family protein [Candidatus Copromorpha excrementigallinarum]|uniref:OadG family protein n=1 Tax=Candidatus Allocopromorpha excrementigallinarum TaxID=2840742 RepID=A0A9D1I1J3_9FIRM|nr:OadG family protein [Candidatus Copromorpha excrementigallinarum]
MGLMEMFANPETFTELSLGEKLAGSGVTALMGMGVTFIVLIILWIFIAIMGKVVSSAEKGDKASEETKAAATPSVAAVSAESASNDSLVAVIAAAIAAYEGSAGSGNLVVRKITRISGEITPWSNAAREDCIESRKF